MSWYLALEMCSYYKADSQPVLLIGPIIVSEFGLMKAPECRDTKKYGRGELSCRDQGAARSNPDIAVLASGTENPPSGSWPD